MLEPLRLSQPSTDEEAVAVLAELGQDIRVVAGAIESAAAAGPGEQHGQPGEPADWSRGMTDQVRQIEHLLRSNGERWLNLARELDRDLLTLAPAPHEWSALECLRHAQVMDGVFAGRFEVILAGGGAFPPFDASAHETGINETGDVAALAASHAAQRAASLELISRAVPADLERTGTHPTLGLVTGRTLLNEWVAHDTMHLIQAERAILQAFIPDTGPWRPFFGEYDAAQATSDRG